MNDELKEVIRMHLVAPAGQFDKHLVHLCQGLVRLEPETKHVRVVQPFAAEKDRVALYCLGKQLIAYLLDDPLLAEVTRTEIERDLAIEPKKVSAYASVLIERDRLLDRGARGSYRARMPGMPKFLTRLRAKLGLTEIREEPKAQD